MKRFSFILSVLVLSISFCQSMNAASIINTKHNLSVHGPGSFVAAAEEQVCIFCHVPHYASPVAPLWNREVGAVSYNLYASSTLNAQPGQPTGATRLCLSCHDGTIAIGMILSRPDPVPMTGGATTIPATSSTNLGSDLADDHPVSFPYTSELVSLNGELREPGALPAAIHLEDDYMMQCTACHDPHKSPYGDFLVIDNRNAGLCRACHQQRGWDSSSHATASAVALDACNNCHNSHNSAVKERLLNFVAEEDNCFSCHDGSVSNDNIAADFNKFYNHPVAATTGVHEPHENPLSSAKHVECVDCHDPHRTNSWSASAPTVSGALAGVKGVNRLGVEVAEVSYEYEVCFRCHADNSFSDTVVVSRQIEEVNERLRFDSINPSYHPVVAIGRNPIVPSLLPQYNPSSRIYCKDCHNSDSGSRSGGGGADGVHGSIYPHILLARYENDTYPLSYSESNYALCFRCHDPQILLDRDRSSFPSHRSHVVGKRMPCFLCHDPHGIPLISGATTTANAHLINFNTDYFTGSYDSVEKSCNVSCHTGPHDYRSVGP